MQAVLRQTSCRHTLVAPWCISCNSARASELLLRPELLRAVRVVVDRIAVEVSEQGHLICAMTHIHDYELKQRSHEQDNNNMDICARTTMGGGRLVPIRKCKCSDNESNEKSWHYGANDMCQRQFGQWIVIMLTYH